MGGPETGRLFSFAARLLTGSSTSVPRLVLRYSLLIVFLIGSAFAAWSWVRPYAWKPDPAARCEVLETLLTSDQSYFWLDVHLKVKSGVQHDLQKPVNLVTGAGKTIEPADTTFGGKEGQGTTEIWFKFWVHSEDLAGPLDLRINDGTLSIKGGQGIPQLGNSSCRNFTTNHW